MAESNGHDRSLNIGFISTRFQGLDGVSLEAVKWASILKEFRHNCFWFAGQLDKDPVESMLVPEAFFGHPPTEALSGKLFSSTLRSRMLTNALHSQKEFLKDKLYEFIDRFDIDLIIPQNVLSIPMHLPLGIAVTELIAETGIPTIAHHHDFFWERTRFLRNACPDILNMAFPPDLPSIKHVVISTMAQMELAARRSIAATVIYNVMDFDAKPPRQSIDGRQFRSEMGFGPGDIIILQPTRVVHRKGIEQAIHLVQRLDLPDIRLVVSHAAGDEGLEYAAWVRRVAGSEGVSLHFIHDKLQEEAARGGNGSKAFSLQDVYPHADLVTYPSLYEGFGNAFLEAVYFKKPLLVNRYSVFVADIEPKGFEVVSMDGFITDSTVSRVATLLRDSEERRRVVEKNFQIARKHFSFQILRKGLASMISGFFGIAPPKGLIERIFRGG
jgi:glycosyltransferase involved in cell wall biosynthesis